MMDLGVSSEQFLKDYYERKFLFRKGALTCTPVTWKDINTALFAWDPHDGSLLLFKDGIVPAERYTETFMDLTTQRSKIVKDIFYALLRDGATLVLNRLEAKSEAVHDLTMEIARFVGERAVANGYVAFGGKGTFAKHWDTHDVFAVQLIGRKHWRVFAPTFPLPLPHQKSKEHLHECTREPLFDGYLEAGDVLYIPRGWWHEAIPLEGAETFHIAVGVHPMRFTDYIAWSCFKTLPSAIDLRRSLKAEINDVASLERAAKAAQELLQTESFLDAFKQEVIAGERVVSRFCIETFGRPRPTTSRNEFRLNSAYRTTRLSAKVSVNGHAISVDEASRKHMTALFSQATISTAESSPCPTHCNKAQTLMEELVARDVASLIPSFLPPAHPK